jgi:hypothetical protein
MQKLILKIEDSHYGLLLQFLKTLDYVQVIQASESEAGSSNAADEESPVHWLEQLAQAGGFSSIEDPVDWQRTIRAERALPR